MKGRAWLVALALVAAGCSRCKSGSRVGELASPVERVLPKGAMGVVVVPSLEHFGQKLRLLEQLKVAGFLAPTQGFADAKALADALVAELGVDLRSAEAVERAGLCAARSLAVSVLVTGGFVALPVKDPERFERWLAPLAARRLGAGTSGEHTVDGVVVKTFVTQVGGVPRLGYAMAHGFALVATDDGVAKLPALARLGEADALSTDQSLARQLARLPGARDAYAFLPTGSPLLAHFPFTSAVLSVSLEATGLTVAFDAPWKPDAAPHFAMLVPQRGDDLLGYLPRDAFAVARFDGEPEHLGPLAIRLLGPALTRAFTEGGFDLRHTALAQLKPGLALALSLADRPPLGQGLPDLDLRHTNPFTYAHLSGVALAKDPTKVVTALDQVAALAPRFGAEMKKVERDGEQAYLTTYAQGEGVHFAVKGDRVFFGSPLPRVQALAMGSGQGGSPVEGLGEGAASVVVDLQRFAQSVRALPESAWGIGGFAMKATTLRWLDATDDLVAVVASVGANEGALQGRVVLSLRLGAKPP